MLTQQGPVNANAFVEPRQAGGGRPVGREREDETCTEITTSSHCFCSHSLATADRRSLRRRPAPRGPGNQVCLPLRHCPRRFPSTTTSGTWRTLPTTPPVQRVAVTFDNTVGKNLVTKGFGDWSAIKTSSMRANVVGDFSKIGLPDIDSTNITSIIGTSNGRGIYVVFDADGSIMQNFFGVGPNVLGISSPQYGITGTTIITESWTVLNGTAIDPADTNAQYFQGVATHEFGHALGMAHTQTNGAALLLRRQCRAQ